MRSAAVGQRAAEGPGRVSTVGSGWRGHRRGQADSAVAGTTSSLRGSRPAARSRRGARHPQVDRARGEGPRQTMNTLSHSSPGRVSPSPRWLCRSGLAVCHAWGSARGRRASTWRAATQSAPATTSRAGRRAARLATRCFSRRRQRQRHRRTSAQVADQGLRHLRR